MKIADIQLYVNDCGKAKSSLNSGSFFMQGLWPKVTRFVAMPL